MSDCPVLAVDLDGTLIRSDMLFETFRQAAAADWTVPFRAAWTLRHGRAVLKARLTDMVEIDPATLPFNGAVQDFIGLWREQGWRVALVTASDQRIADQIAAYVGLFDEVHGSDGTLNLKGPAKAAFLRKRFGTKGYVYIGDAFADLPVWADAARAVVVTPSRALRRKVAALGVPYETIGTGA